MIGLTEEQAVIAARAVAELPPEKRQAFLDRDAARPARPTE